MPTSSTTTRYPAGSLLASEIAGQPALWLDTAERLVTFLGSNRLPTGPVVLTGAGTSAYAGQAISAAWSGSRAIPTTDLILLSRDEILTFIPGLDTGGLLVSLARSGDSPESVGVVQRLQRLFPAVQHLVITCNADGRLAQLPDVQVLALNPATNDRSLAMTASFSNLTLAGLLLQHADSIRPHLPAICDAVTASVEQTYATALEIAATGSNRFVVLTSSMPSLAAEAALKALELTAGARIGIAESFLGFRHGPTSVLRQDTPVFCITSSDPYKLQYEEDFVRDLHRRGVGKIALIGAPTASAWPHDWLLPALAPMLPDALRTPFEILPAQIFAYASSLSAGVDPDNPSPGGEVTRVVKPFQLHLETA